MKPYQVETLETLMLEETLHVNVKFNPVHLLNIGAYIDELGIEHNYVAKRCSDTWPPPT